MLVGDSADSIDEAEEDAFAPGRRIVLETDTGADIDATIDLDSMVSTEVDAEGNLLIRMNDALLLVTKRV
ncbi:MAG: hypothetical protein EON55_25840 [Alphaproteobacteria bacterium]|nr:MAG: hypothetical protein EON55_25840 [Alphaproteobacteria bacterium]